MKHWTETIIVTAGEKSPAFPIRPRPVPFGWFVIYDDRAIPVSVWRVARFRVTRRWRMT